MKKSILNIGKQLNKLEQKSIQGGNSLMGSSVNTTQITANRHYWEHTGVFYDEHRNFDGTTL